MRVQATSSELIAAIDRSNSLISIVPFSAGEPSDERQGQIVNGQNNGVIVLNPGYVTWLNSRGLNSASNQQTVAVFDTGYDNGDQLLSQHPNLENPKRLVASRDFASASQSALVPDVRGHGTMVADIIAGDATTVSPQSAQKDQQGYYWGQGIAPKSKIVAIRVFNYLSNCALDSAHTGTTVSQLDLGFNFARKDGMGNDLALIANHSWNGSQKYDGRAQLFDQRVIDAYSIGTSFEPMTIVVSAGNVFPLANQDSVSTPATAKNVIAVGSTQDYRPSGESGAAPLQCTASGTVTEEANNISQVNGYSARGKTIGTTLGSDVRSVRVKPDLVAPGGRAHSAVPFQVPTLYHCPICRQYWPDPVTGYHSYNQGTSFSAPVVSGAAALTRKWLLDRNAANPAPSLVKAALIATADDIGGATVDHRPSNIQGWGRVNIDRLSDSAAKFYVNDNLGLAVTTGQERTWTRTIEDPTKPTFLVLVWSDPPSAVNSLNSQVPLVNDVRLRLDGVGFAKFWFGNTFRGVVPNPVEL